MRTYKMLNATMKPETSHSLNVQIERTGVVVEFFSEIERLIDEIIFGYIQPAGESENFVRRNLLNNSVVSFGSKIKLVLAIAKEKPGSKINRDKLHRLLSIRNAFAHNSTFDKFEVDFSLDHIDTYFYIESMVGDGSIKRVKRDDAYAEFYELHTEIKESLGNLLKLV